MTRWSICVYSATILKGDRKMKNVNKKTLQLLARHIIKNRTEISAIVFGILSITFFTGYFFSITSQNSLSHFYGLLCAFFSVLMAWFAGYFCHRYEVQEAEEEAERQRLRKEKRKAIDAALARAEAEEKAERQRIQQEEEQRRKQERVENAEKHFALTK